MGHTLTATRKNNLYGPYPDGYLSGTPLKDSDDCLESAYMGLHPDGHPSESTTYAGPTLTATRKNSLYGSYPDSYPSESPQKTKIQGVTQEHQEQ